MEYFSFFSKLKGVPVTSQWSPKKGHIYSVQVAQFGLSHFSKWIRDKRKEPESISLNNPHDWYSASKGSELIKNNDSGFEFALKGSSN